MKKFETPQLRLQEVSSTSEARRPQCRMVRAAGSVDQSMRQGHIVSDGTRPMGADPVLGKGLCAPARNRSSIIVKLLLALVITASASGSVMACPGGYYRCGPGLCCPL